MSMLNPTFKILHCTLFKEDLHIIRVFLGWTECLSVEVCWNCDMTAYQWWEKESRSARVNSERQELAWDAIDEYFMRWGLADSGWDRSWGSLRTLSDRRLGQRASWAFCRDGADRKAIRPRYPGRRGSTLPLVSSSVLQPEGNKSTIPWRTEALVLFSAHNPNQLGTAD